MFTTFRKVLVANRGEIAIRVLRACSELGMATVAVYSEADRTSLHVRYADEAYPIGPAPARESYLRIDKLIGVARLAGADAIHPGYGFLAENPAFAEACAEAGITFIGPSARSIRLMGDKLAARQTAQSLGLPVVPGSDGTLADEDEAAAVADAIGYPIFIKAVAGGGGKGMRVVHSREGMSAAFRAARSEADAAFGDGRVYLEKMMDHVRHVEVQILADRHGNVIHLGERECSVQRRHQKLIEEAPAPGVTRDLRHNMGEAAVKLARETGYETVGTVEFLLDRNRHFYFLEMNTRVQVEHPVTEMVTGVDIVTEQIRAASGRKLRLRQTDVRLKGWAIECRIAAEDPYNDFLPSIGKVTSVDEPSGPGVRVDSSLYEGSEVSLYYDPLIAKLIVYGETRGQAIQRMRRAVAEFKILGINTNIPFHLRMMESPTFIAGRVHTAFLEQAGLLEESSDVGRAKIAAIAAAAVAYRENQAAVARMVGQKSAEASPWRLVARREGWR